MADELEPAVPSPKRWDYDWLPIYFVTLLLVAFLLIIGVAGQAVRDQPQAGSATGNGSGRESSAGELGLGPVSGRGLPGGIKQIFADNRLLVAYSGTAGTGSLGVLGEGTPEEMMPRLATSAKIFAATGRPVLPVFELVATVAHAGPTGSGQYNSDIDRASVQAYIDAARRYGALVVLDLQPGRASFVEVAKRWEWALRDPLVGLALDPEWRLGPTGVPGQQIGSVSAAEVNEVSAWLADLVDDQELPEKVFAVHQFRADMVTDIAQVAARPGLAMVQHLDGFGTPQAKLTSFRELARPQQFHLGFTLFREEDLPRTEPAAVLKIKPQVSYVSFQ